MEWPSWGEIITLLGVSGGSGILGKVLVDKKQNAQISSLKKSVKEQQEKINTLEVEVKTNIGLRKIVEGHDQRILKNEMSIETNTMFDKKFEKDWDKKHSEINNRIDNLDSKIDEKFEVMTDRIITLIKSSK